MKTFIYQPHPVRIIFGHAFPEISKQELPKAICDKHLGNCIPEVQIIGAGH